MDSPHILVLGAGSAGKRHARNLRALGCRISAFDPREDRLREATGEGPLLSAHTKLDAALGAHGYDGFVIASPPVFHVDQVLAIAARHERWILCEKPLSITAAEARRLEPVAGRVLLGYTYRWWPPLGRFRGRLQAGEIGKLHTLRFVMSAHLADWHPWERYQDFFMANREQGGGALLDESHFIDLMLWIAGWPAKVYAQVERISALEINADDNVDILVSYASGLRVNLHLDLLGRPHERSITAMGEGGTLAYVYEENAIKLCREGAANWQRETFTCERNEMFVGAAKEFLARMRGDSASPFTCSVADGIRALRIVDACRESSASGRAVLLTP